MDADSTYTDVQRYDSQTEWFVGWYSADRPNVTPEVCLVRPDPLMPQLQSL